MTTRSYIAVFVVTTAIAGVTVGAGRAAHAQDAAPAVSQQRRAPRVDPVTVALTAVNPTDAQKAQIDGIVKKYRSEREVLTPDQREQIAASEAKEVAEVKAALTADQQIKFQAAYDAAKLAQTSGPVLALLSERLKLTDEEKSKVAPIVAEYAEQSLKLRQDSTLEREARREKLTALWDAVKAKIRPLLTPDQQTALDGITSPRGGRGGGGNRAGASGTQ